MLSSGILTGSGKMVHTGTYQYVTGTTRYKSESVREFHGCTYRYVLVTVHTVTVTYFQQDTGRLFSDPPWPRNLKRQASGTPTRYMIVGPVSWSWYNRDPFPKPIKWNLDFQYMPGIYHVYPRHMGMSPICLVYTWYIHVYAWCIQCRGYTWYIQGYTMPVYIHKGYTWYILVYTWYIWGRIYMVYPWYIHVYS